MPSTTRDGIGLLLAALLGVAAFFLLAGWTTLIPTNIAWLNVADRAMHTLGWMYFRAAPWGNPPGLNPHLGIELSSSIALVDGLPLFALPFKVMAAWLPQPFQYWGYWLLLSFALQSMFAYAIARELLASRLAALLAAGFVLITPAFMFRVPMHLALSGHWVLLAGLYLYVRRVPPVVWMWPLLLALTAAIHAYLLAMVMGLWVAALAQRLWSGQLSWRRATGEIALVFAATSLVLWTAGFFVSGSTGSYGYGDYKLNLLWPLITYGNWSRLFPDLPHTHFDYEGLSFLGIGILLLIALGIASGAVGLKRVLDRRWLPLLIVLLLMMGFAFSNDFQLAGVHLGKVPVPKLVETIASTFRSTGRFVWPLLYFITIGAVVLVARKFRAGLALPLIAAALAVQAFDSGPALLGFSGRLRPPAPTWDTPLQSPFWARAVAAGYTRIRAIPVINPGKDWKALGYFAVTHGLDIDSAYLGRTNDTAMAALRTTDDRALTTGSFEPKTLYELDLPSALAAQAFLGPDDLLAIIDSRVIFARGGAALVDGLGIEPRINLGN